MELDLSNMILVLEEDTFKFKDKDGEFVIATSEDEICKCLSKGYELDSVGNKFQIDVFKSFFDVESYVRREKLKRLNNITS